MNCYKSEWGGHALDYSIFLETPEERNRRRTEDILKISRRVSSFFWDSSPKRPNFEEREGQADMAFEILDAIKNDQHILVEAGVGIGKSFAYLVPLLLYTDQGAGTIVIATSTIALQEQLMRDIRFLHEQLGTRLKVVLAKGQTNYACMKRVEEYQARPDSEMPEELAASLAAGHQDRAEYPADLPQGLWEQICIKQFGQRCRKCHHTHMPVPGNAQGTEMGRWDRGLQPGFPDGPPSAEKQRVGRAYQRIR